VGLSSSLPHHLYSGLVAEGVPRAAAAKVASLPPTATVFGAFLGDNPIGSLLGPSGVLRHLPHAKVAYLTGRSFFPSLISAPFVSGLHEAFDFAMAAVLVAAAASWLRGGREVTGAGLSRAEASVLGTPRPSGGATSDGGSRDQDEPELESQGLDRDRAS
ncbi:MAG: MFS transporter, partial [Acidimicrobiales bacterium]